MCKWSLESTAAIFLCALFLTCGFGVNVFAQARKAAPGGPAAAVSQAGKEIQVRKVEMSQIRTPEYSSSVNEATITANNWTRILVRFDTEADWIDQLEMRFYIVVKNSRTSAYTMFTGTFVYSEVSKGRNHQAAVFLRPRTTERYGVPERAGVEVYSKGELVSAGSWPEDNKAWWRTATANLRTVEGYVLERSQTPFAFIAVDNYEVPKAK